jgi:hypothetical protein
VGLSQDKISQVVYLSTCNARIFALIWEPWVWSHDISNPVSTLTQTGLDLGKWGQSFGLQGSHVDKD